MALAMIVTSACGTSHKSAGTPAIHRSGDLSADPASAAIGLTITLHGTNWPTEQISVGVFLQEGDSPPNFLRTYAGQAYSRVATIGATSNFSLTYVIPESLAYDDGQSVTLSAGMKLLFFTKEPGSAHTGPTVSIVAK